MVAANNHLAAAPTLYLDFSEHINVVQGCTDSWIPAPFAVPSIAARAGKCPEGRGDESPRLRSSTWMYCLSNPARARSTGDFDSQDANQNTASGA
jgi:hypothetical protein